MNRSRWWAGRLALLGTFATLGCSGGVGQAAEFGAVDAEPNAVETRAADAAAPTDRGTGDQVAGQPGFAGALAGAGTVSASARYRMVANLGAPLTDTMQATSPSYRMTTSLVALGEASL